MPVQQFQEHIVATQTIPQLPEIAIVQALVSQTLLVESIRRRQEAVYEFQGDGIRNYEESVALESLPLVLGEGSELHGSANASDKTSTFHDSCIIELPFRRTHQ